MKAVHVGLLVLGAALAGGLAVKMTQLPPIPASSSIPVSTPAATLRKPVIERPAVAPPPKPSPMPTRNASSPAPPTIYTEPERRPSGVRPVIVIPRRREEIARERPLDVPPLPPEQAAPVPVQAALVAEPAKIEQPAPPKPPPAPRRVVLQPGTTIRVRIDEALSTDRNVAGSSFTASLAEPIVVDGLVIAERGARVTGRVLDSQNAGRVSGVSMLELALASITTADGQRISIATDPWTRRGDTSRGADAWKVGGGAAIGAGIGAGAGTGVVLATRGKPVEVSSETIVGFRVSYAVTITERKI